VSPASSPNLHIRRLTTIEECREVARLERAVWQYSDAEDVIPPAILIASIRRGAILLGAFDDEGVMVGYVYSVPGLTHGRAMQWSHALAVLPSARGGGTGRLLKLAQRDAVIAMGLDLIEWTFDPLLAVNAHFNFARLGVVSQVYEENVYGDSSSPLHAGAPTDRLLVEWRITTPHVERRIGSHGPLAVRASGVSAATVVSGGREVDGALVPGTLDLDCEARRVLVEIPAGFDAMLAADPSLAREWRLSTRRVFETYFGRGYRAVDFFLGEDRGRYLLVRT
jgi:predicted GNAT superfamily acetyltransferase